ncbi:CPBP family intramembrane glutamic endopeptidase [Candidatus Halobonum tyrrellensis]|uniref:CAAX prenyl protease 2/Lysostaphin resistance protein A-like domain-containing protein n=1 Tax=Candidatus Halobonum tyrrellensis G22 TaxID=1324957 RepID=V4H985_9EURY|nr:CPBP family intramembrane glutamic endopeptidase [Candidatus Halobonum tyrrellensis]ESP87280.1 hypothetical protein K933_14378 [Candidatus Halobonum tyrrellensis G22]
MSEPSAAAAGADRRLPLPAVAAGAMLLWVLAEFALRRGLAYALLAPKLGTSLGADAVVMVVGFPLIAAAVALLGRRAGVDPADWDYRLSRRAVGTGVAGFVAYVAVAAAALFAASLAGSQPSSGLAGGSGGAGLPAWVVALFLLGNGVVVPVAEELAWRGVIQTALTDAYGTSVAVSVTAVGFVAKHLVVDLAAMPFRVFSLAVLAVVFCALRARYGTTSSTVAHVLVNLLSTASLLTAL